ncbi:MAG: hypothetical protein H7Z75_22590 [Ferruginibacter sp.]|nr:hypothetical protein [Cytophagales bacterium]
MKRLLGGTPAMWMMVLLVFPSAGFAQPNQPLSQQAVLLARTLEKNHYQPRALDDGFSERVFVRFLHLLDPHRLYFTAADIGALSAYRRQLDDELRGDSWQFLPRVTTLYQQRLTQAEPILGEILRKPFDFSNPETIAFSETDSLDFAADEAAYGQRWRKWLKYQTLRQMAGIAAESHAGDPNGMLAAEPAARQQVGAVEKRNLRRTLEHPGGYANCVGALFFNAVAACFDPHSAYFSKTDYENFESALSKEALSFGMDLDENEAGRIVIARLVPGGPAWKSNELHKDDVLTGLRWSGNPAVDLAGADVAEVESLLQSTNAGQLELIVRKTSGVVKTVSLTKEKIREENIVKSLVLQGERKIGYLSLPGFYTEWENPSGLGCANDVAKEIVKLKEERIDGLILDIRYNGGGSLEEGLNLAGIFVDEGPLFVTRGRDGKPAVLKDLNRGTVYDGPLVVLVNGQSASASEILASTLQDYHRALIVGSPTFGKATSQVVLPLDPARRTAGHVKVTVDKLYRLDGKSAQLGGVRPDVYLPDLYESVNYREASLPFALPADSLTRKIVYAPLRALPTEELARRSQARVATNPSFQLIRQIADYGRSHPAEESKAGVNPGTRTVPLTLAHFRDRTQQRYQWWQAWVAAEKGHSNELSVQNHRFDQAVTAVDAYGKEMNDLLIGNIQRDAYVGEACRILHDLLSLPTK